MEDLNTKERTHGRGRLEKGPKNKAHGGSNRGACSAGQHVQEQPMSTKTPWCHKIACELVLGNEQSIGLIVSLSSPDSMYRALTKCLSVFGKNAWHILNGKHTHTHKPGLHANSLSNKPPSRHPCVQQLCFCTSSAFSSQSWSDVSLAAFLSVQKDLSMTHQLVVWVPPSVGALIGSID